MKLKLISPVSMLISSLIYAGLGIFFVIFWSLGIEILVFVSEIVILILSILMINSFLFKMEKGMISSLVGGILFFIVATFAFVKPEFIEYSLAFFVGIWAFINFLWRMILCIQLHKNHDSEFWRAATDCSISLIFAILFLFNPIGNVNILSILIGFYLIIHGITTFMDFIRVILKWDLDGKHVKRFIHWAPPVFITAFLPKKIITKINQSLVANELVPEIIETKKTEEKYLDTKLEVFIHMAHKIAKGFGHCDICFDDVVYSYGTYDESTCKMGGIICDGVLAKMPVKSYINHCLNVDRENIVGFSIWVSKNQEKELKKELKKLNDNCTEWKSPAEKLGVKDCNDSASVLYYTADAKFFKFKKGKFKTYFAVTTNCVMLADTIIKAAGIDGIKMNGIVTPGTYLAFLNNQFSRKNTVVVKRRILV